MRCGLLIAAILLISGCSAGNEGKDVCQFNSDCTPISPCYRVQCVDNRCKQTAKSPHVLPDTNPRDCVRPVCDGSARVVMAFEPDGTKLADDKLGDCRIPVCDGNGKATHAQFHEDTANDDNPCTRDVCTGGRALFTPLPVGTRIGNDAVGGDCQSMRCDGKGKAALSFDKADPTVDDNRCTRDICTATGTDHTPVAAGTVVKDAFGNCRSWRCGDGDMGASVVNDFDVPLPASPCERGTCKAGKPGQKLKLVGTTFGAGGSTCKSNGRCDRCPEVDKTCSDSGPGEPNESPSAAFVLGDINDLDQNGSFLCGVLSGPTDVDWYVYSGTDAGGWVDPARSFSRKQDMEVCAFFVCNRSSDKPSFSCPSGSKNTTAEGMPGCCAQRPFTVSLDCLPSGGLFGKDNAKVFMRVRSTLPVNSCQPYELRYHY